MKLKIANNQVPVQRAQGNQIQKQLVHETRKQTCDLVLHDAAKWDPITLVVSVQLRISKEILFGAGLGRAGLGWAGLGWPGGPGRPGGRAGRAFSALAAHLKVPAAH